MKDIRLSSPLKGELIALQDVKDPVFAGGAMGRGAAIRNPEGKVYAPFDGEITVFFETKHAIGLKSKDGVELLIHVGMDTVNLKGEHFTAKAAQGDKITKGQLLLEFNPEGIAAAGYDTTTPVVVTNHDQYGSITFELDGETVTSQADGGSA
ncbi:MAG: PTS glucose transporter subunit IIA, partial [Selenomonadaceae bacterium]|nr:PTS glucose transporter subunit IIA [Selenomonadaceae bacterium]